MATSSRKEIRDRVIDTAKQLDGQKGSLVNELINLTIMEIQSPAWAFESGETNHLWNFNKRNTSITTVASTSDYILARDIDKISVAKQTDKQSNIKEITESNFLELINDISNPSGGDPEWYAIHSVQGNSTDFGLAAEKVKVKSSSATDDGDVDLSVTIQGFSGGIMVSESLVLDGAAYVNGTITFDADRPIFVSKSKTTAGDITVVGQTSGTVYITLGIQDRNPVLKVVSFYPVPNAAKTIILNYYTALRPLNNDSDTPGFDEKWHHSVFWGTLAKVYMHLGKETDYAFAFGVYKKIVLSMVQADRDKPNLIDQLKRHSPDRLSKSGFTVKATDAVIV